MKTNPALQKSLNFNHPAQLVWYSAHVLLAALQNSPSAFVQAAIPGVVGKPAVIGQNAHPAYPARAAIPANENTSGYVFGELYKSSPAYPRLTPVPAIPAKAATAEVIAVAGITAKAPIPSINAPAVVALPGWQDAIDIVQTSNLLTVTAELPVATNVGLVGSSKTIIGEITPSALQANAWLDEKGDTEDYGFNLYDPSIAIMEQLFYKNALECKHTVSDTVRIVNAISVPCKRIVVTLYALSGFDAASDSLQLSKIRGAGNIGS
jgi:hypothetical protein